MKFEIGDIVKGKYENGYVITNSHMKRGEVIACSGEDLILVKVIEHVFANYIGEKHWVSPERFDLVEQASMTELSEPTEASLEILFG